MVWERIKSVRAVAETKLIGESIESLSIFLHQTTKIKHSTQMLIYMNVASVSPHMRKTTMQTEGLSRIHRDFHLTNFATERNMLGVIGETVGWPITAHQE